MPCKRPSHCPNETLIWPCIGRGPYQGSRAILVVVVAAAAAEVVGHSLLD